MPLAIVQMADTPQIESTAVMLRHAGYEVKICNQDIINKLIAVGCDTIIPVSRMVSLGYDALDSSIEEATLKEVDTCDLFVEMKVRNIPRIRKNWPRLENKIMYWKVNGGQPEICLSGTQYTDEINLPCPVVSACLWYGTPRYYRDKNSKVVDRDYRPADDPRKRIDDNYLFDVHKSLTTGENGMAYTFWPPYPRSAEYDSIIRDAESSQHAPHCVCYRVEAWGYGLIIPRCIDLGIEFYGTWSPLDQISHSDVPKITKNSKALVHMKSVDCPGWALYEAMLGGCPVITGRVFSGRMLAFDLLEHNETCLEFGIPPSFDYGHGPIDEDKCVSDIEDALKQLSDPAENKRIGDAGKKRLNELMWNAERDGESFISFMRRWYG